MFFFGAFLIFTPVIAPLLAQSHPFLALGLLVTGFVGLVLTLVYGVMYLFWRECLALATMLAVCVIPF